MSKKNIMDLKATCTLEDAIKTLSKMRASYPDIYFDAACASISELFGVSLSKIEELASKA